MSDPIRDNDLLDYVRDLYDQRRSTYEPDWYRNLHAYENNHFVGWNRILGTVQFSPFRKRFFMQLPEVKKQVDGWENGLLMGNPVYQIYPTDYSSDLLIQQARIQSLFLRQHHLDWHEDNVLHSLVHNAGVMPISYLEIAVSREYDLDLQRYIKTTVPRVYDAFDILWDTHYLFEENAAVIKIIRTTPKRIAESKLYSGFTGAKVAAGNVDYKELYYMDKLGSSSFKDNERVNLYEVHMKEIIDDQPCVIIKTIDGNGNVLRTVKDNGMPFYSIIPFQPFSGNPYQPSLAQNQLPINRSLDLIGNRIESMAMKYVKGSYMMPANTEVTMSDEDGTLLKYTGSVAPTPLQQPVAPSWAFAWQNWLQQQADRYGRNSITLGGVPKGSNIRSGKMMDKVNQNQTSQDKTPIDNLMYTMKQAARVVMYRQSRLMDEPRQFTLDDPNGSNGYTQTKMVGEDWYPLYKQDPTVVPLPKTVNKMTVEIEDESQHGIEAKRSAMERLIGIYDKTPPELQRQVLDVFKVGDTADIMNQADMKKSLLDSPEFQAIIANNRAGMYDNDPAFKQAVATLMQKLAGTGPEKNVNDQAVQAKGAAKPATPEPAKKK